MESVSDQFKKIIKSKGTGKTMSKHMDTHQIAFVLSHLNHPDIPLARRATLLTALCMLKNTPEETQLLNQLKSDPTTYLPPELHYFFNPDPNNSTDTHIHTLLQHNPLSKQTITTLFSNATTLPAEKMATILEALRLKEETTEENTAIIDYFKSSISPTQLNIPQLIDIATPYDGFNRSYFLQPFVCALLASIGIPSVIHGVHEVSPKQGLTTHKLLKKAHKNPLKSIQDVANAIENPDIGWGYIDQSIFCPELYNYNQIRIDMVKRPVLATIEKWLHPFAATHTLCVTGFTHPPYKQKTLDIIAHTKTYQQLLLVRGVEGSTLLPPDRRTPYITASLTKDNTYTTDHAFMAPKDLDYETITIPDQAPEDSLEKGIEGLSNPDSPIADYLCYQALAICNALEKDIPNTRIKLESAIASGSALDHWERY
jgi:anthranilate phosphoribosyltransferase